MPKKEMIPGPKTFPVREATPVSGQSTIVQSLSIAKAIASGNGGGLSPASLTISAQGSGALSANVDPGLVGPFTPTDKPISFFAQSKPQVKCEGQLYTYSQVSSGPIVLILPADGAGNPAYLAYSALGKHLASHGFHVFSMSKDPVHQDKLTPGDLLQEACHYLFGENTVPQNAPSPIISRLPKGNEIALIGHSAGGRMSISAFKTIRKPTLAFAKPRNLRSLVLFAPSFSPGVTYEDFLEEWTSHDADAGTDSFLGMHMVGDTDSNAYGKKAVNKPMLSAFLIYDMLGRNDPINNVRVEKDMIFVDWSGGIPFKQAHYFQGEKFALAYVAAFLLKNVVGKTEFDAFFKHQVRPASLQSFTKEIWIQHEQRQRVMLMDMDHSSSWLAGFEKSAGISLFENYQSQWDSTSPHNTKVLKIVWDRTTPQGQTSSNWFRLELKNPLTLDASYTHLSFRIGQSSPALQGQSKQPLDLLVTLSNLKSVRISSVSSKIPFPTEVKFDDPQENKSVNSTKSAMRTYVLPLALFGLAKGGSLVTTWVRFTLFDIFSLTSNGNNKAILNLDSVAFWR